ncbi:MAG: nicotianamine synthase family protein [archaeon]
MPHEKTPIFSRYEAIDMISLPAIQSFHENLETLSTELQGLLLKSGHPAVEKQVELATHALEHLIFTHRFTPVQEKTLLKMDTIAHTAHLTRQAYAYYEKDVEKTHVLSLLEQEKPEWSMNHSLLRRKYALSMREGHLAHVKPMERMIMIGSGYYPVSAIVFARKFGARVFLHETDEEAKMFAQKALDKTRMGGRISFMENKKVVEGIRNADIAWLAGPTENKRKWMEELETHTQPGTRILCRSAHGLRALLHEHVPLNRLPTLTKVGMIHPRKTEIESTVLMIR